MYQKFAQRLNYAHNSPISSNLVIKYYEDKVNRYLDVNSRTYRWYQYQRYRGSY